LISFVNGQNKQKWTPLFVQHDGARVERFREKSVRMKNQELETKDSDKGGSWKFGTAFGGSFSSCSPR
jgi:hypothetical protein